VDAWWDFKESPLEATYKPTGQKIYFRGLDDPLKVTSITVDVGVLCWAWLEEAYEVMKEDDFNILDESIRGECPEGLWKQITFTFNPWNERHWLKHRFFDELVGYDAEGQPVYKERGNPVSDDGEILAITTNYTCNEWLDKADIAVFERMKKNNPRRYAVAGLGGWGIVEGLVYENWKEERFELEDIQQRHPDLDSAFGLDFGYTNDPSALFGGFISLKDRKIYVWDEMYKKGLSNRKIYDEIRSMGYVKEHITGDSAEPKSIDELSGYGLRIEGAVKGKDSINNGIQFIQDFEIIVHPRCVNFMTEISNYTWKVDKFNKKLNVPIDDFNHLMDAMRYALEKFIMGDDWMY
jgi:phage terminase large subunit